MAAVSYYTDYRDEIDAEIADADEASPPRKHGGLGGSSPHESGGRCPLALDERLSPAVGATLRDLGDDVIVIADRTDLRAMTDDAVLAGAAGCSLRTLRTSGR